MPLTLVLDRREDPPGELVSDAIHMTQTDTGVRALTRGRFPISPVGLAAMTDWPAGMKMTLKEMEKL